MPDLETLAKEPFCCLTTIGRTTGRLHEIEIWFAVHGTTLYLLSGGRGRSDWVKNLVRTPNVTVRIGTTELTGRARLVEEDREDGLARRLLLEKYQPDYSGDLSNWGRTALPVALDVHVDQ